MAVDANVLIYERMREEAGDRARPRAGHRRRLRRAPWSPSSTPTSRTILGAALILFQFGAGPVRGFAWTLSIGVVTSVFTAVLVTQFLIACGSASARPKKLPI